ncbi:YrhB domain-containing protein [Sorangium sp. So ce1036]|uniref:YrhB domain-containing protein n=1 Tax=Sorangium sp. So ce1036 TaxID=3133328 RepID=UPI003F074DB0
MTWTKEQALQAARSHLKSKYGLGEDVVVFLDELTKERPYGWVFFYESRRFVEAGDMMYAFGGNGSLIADVSRERIVEVGTAKGLDAELRRVGEQEEFVHR